MEVSVTRVERRWFYYGHAAVGGWFGLFNVWIGNEMAARSPTSAPYSPLAAFNLVAIFACIGIACAVYKRRRPTADELP
jgi:apolipoprotein N-acyltransferase